MFPLAVYFPSGHSQYTTAALTLHNTVLLLLEDILYPYHLFLRVHQWHILEISTHDAMKSWQRYRRGELIP